MVTKTKKSILIVDDEMAVRESLRQILKPQYEIFTAADGHEALECVRQNKVDLITLDLKMPGLSGIDVLREVKKLRDDVEVIIITAYGTATNAGESIYFGAGDFIIKPFDVFDINTKIKKSLDRQSKNLEIKKLIRQIREALPVKEKKKDEKLLFLFKDLCAMLETGEFSFPAGIQELMNLQLKHPHSPRTEKQQPVNEKH
jgi:two-component system response regulator (stage 0 sporulation protein F)